MKDRVALIILGIFVLLIVGIVIFSPSSNDENESIEEYTISKMKELSVAEFIETINSDGINIVYIMNTGCSYCTIFSPILDSIVEDNDMTVGYLNLYNIATQDEYNEFATSDDYFSGEFGTPTTMIFDSNELVDVIPGYVEKEAVIEFFIDNNIID